MTEKICENCKKTFSCHSESIKDCFCSSYTLSNELSNHLSQFFSDCLCRDCLNYFITHKKGLVEGIDYSIDHLGLFVFSKQYHIKRGYCCHNNCRECPY